MRIFTKTISLVVVITLVSLIAFFFWGSSSNIEPSDYSLIKVYRDGRQNYIADTLSVITYNIGYLSGMTNNLAIERKQKMFDENLRLIYQLFEKSNPDFVGFQEIDFFSQRSFFVNQLDSIALAMNYGWSAKVINWDKKYVPFPYWPVKVHFGKMLSGQAVLSRFPILSNERIVLPKPDSNPFYYNAFYLDRLIQITEIDVKEQKLILINVHLEAFDPQTRRKQSDILMNILDKYEDKYPVLLIGDFNSPPTFDQKVQPSDNAIHNILGSGVFKSAISEIHYREEPESYYTFNSENPAVMIDYIFYNERILPLQARVLDEAGTISDHLPVQFKFIIKNN